MEIMEAMCGMLLTNTMDSNVFRDNLILINKQANKQILQLKIYEIKGICELLLQSSLR